MLPRYFAEWGFKRLGDKVNKRYLSYTFASQLFRRDQPHLCNSMRLIKKNKRSRAKKILFHLFDATEEPTAKTNGYMTESPVPAVNQVKMSSWENTSPQSLPYPWGQYDQFPFQHYLPQPSRQYLPWPNRHDWISPSPKHHQEKVLESKTRNSREASAAVALMNLANFAEVKLSRPPTPRER